MSSARPILSFQERGRGPVLLLVHGFPLNGRMWEAQGTEFSRDHRVIAPDLCGFGLTPPASNATTMADHADDLARLLDSLQIDRPVVFCGLSLGGYIAWQFAQRHASRLAGLIISDSRAVADTEEAARGRRLMSERVLREGTGFVADAMLPKLLAPGAVETRPELAESIRSLIAQASPQGIASTQRGMAERSDVRELLPQLRFPVLVICGALDQISPPAEMQAIAAAIPNARYAQIAAAGHLAPLENPTDWNAAVRTFLYEAGL